MTLAIEADPFATPQDLAGASRDSIITGGRYRLPNLDGSHRAGGWMRVSNLVGAFSDQKALQDWEVRMILLGLRLRRDLYDRLAALPLDALELDEIKALISEVAEEAKNAAGGGDGAAWGTARHSEVEALHAGIPYAFDGPARVRLAAYSAALERAGLEALPGMQERRVCLPDLDVCGTLDNILLCQRTGLLHIGDLKTQRRFWTWLEIEAQLAVYSRGAGMWDPVTGTWEPMPAVDQSIGCVIWMPRPAAGSDEVVAAVKGVDLERGWSTAILAHRIVERRSEAKRARGNRSGWDWTGMPDEIRTEQYARRFAAAATPEEGSRLVAEALAAGLWTAELAQCATLAAQRLRALPA